MFRRDNGIEGATITYIDINRSILRSGDFFAEDHLRGSPRRFFWIFLNYTDVTEFCSVRTKVNLHGFSATKSVVQIPPVSPRDPRGGSRGVRPILGGPGGSKSGKISQNQRFLGDFSKKSPNQSLRGSRGVADPRLNHWSAPWLYLQLGEARTTRVSSELSTERIEADPS